MAYEQQKLEELAARRDWMTLEIMGRTSEGVANHYRVTYAIRSLSGVEDAEHIVERAFTNKPLYADTFVLDVTLPPAYPSIDAMPSFRFLTADDDGNPLPHPWHPNIRWYEPMAGRVCINMPDTYSDLAWCVERIARYLRYEIYHAVNEPPYPEDLKVAQWVLNNDPLLTSSQGGGILS